jgi:hypothetical protein
MFRLQSNSALTDLSDASVSSIKGSVALGRARTGALTIAFLNSSNALSCSSRRVVGPRGIYIGPGYIEDIKKLAKA